jgi:hypothetical protein
MPRAVRAGSLTATVNPLMRIGQVVGPERLTNVTGVFIIPILSFCLSHQPLPF